MATSSLVLPGAAARRAQAWHDGCNGDYSHLDVNGEGKMTECRGYLSLLPFLLAFVSIPRMAFFNETEEV